MSMQPGTQQLPAMTAGQPAPWWASIQQQMASTQQHMARVASEIQVSSKSWKFPDLSKAVGVKLDVDVLSPALTTVKQQYDALPEPIRDVMPFAGVAAVTSLAVSRVYEPRLQQAQQRYSLLYRDHEQLQAQMAGLEAQLHSSTSNRSHMEVQMADAVARATTVAAAAATAAASAAAAAAAAAGQNSR